VEPVACSNDTAVEITEPPSGEEAEEPYSNVSESTLPSSSTTAMFIGDSVSKCNPA
jgi:hypothetical protein